MQRIIFAIKNGIMFRKHISAILHDNNTIVNDVTMIDHVFLRKEKIKVLVLDFDGVLASHGKKRVDQDIMLWLKNIEKQFDGKIAILSNKPDVARALFFNKYFPEINFITQVAKKPYPYGLLYIINQYMVQPREVILVDDRVLTGVLACMLASTKVLYIKKARTDYKNYFFKEIFFSILRFIEKRIFIKI